MKKIFITFILLSNIAGITCAEDPKMYQEDLATSTSQKETPTIITHNIFDDRMVLKGYSQKYKDVPKDVLLEMIKDDTLDPFKTAAAVRVFNENYSQEVVSSEKKQIEKILLRRLNKTDSPFVEVEIMFTLCRIDRYRYFKSMAPALIQKLNHYNEAINEIASEHITALIQTGNNRAREARIIFNTLRKILFLERRRLADITVPPPKLARKLKSLRWSIKALGNEYLKKLPKEVVPLL
ncbi:MAG: hypothetical protein H6755_07365 [Candidatus Omnitrophica bacterium]|nr:hypothetical protein [Candidatus Omnitrophota bacterium]